VRHVEHAVEVDRHDVLPVLDHGAGLGGERVAAIDAGIVDQDRDVADLAGDSGRHDAAGVAVRDVECERMRLADAIEDLLGGLGCTVGIHVQHDHPGAFARIAERDGAADARACAGDGGDVRIEKRHGVSPAVVPVETSKWIAGLASATVCG
jgi:hypothetical protein